MPTLHVVRVFCAEDGSHGNPAGVFLDGHEVPVERRPDVAADLGFAETVFVDDAAGGAVRIFTPAVELDFAGHPAVGVAWLLGRERARADALAVPAGRVGVRYEDDVTFVTVRPSWGPPFEWERLEAPEYVDALLGPPRGHDLVGVWAWIDEPAGIVRARVFPLRIGIPEDEATGSAAQRLCVQLGRALEIRQGRGSRIRARPLEDGSVELGGRTVLHETRAYALP